MQYLKSNYLKPCNPLNGSSCEHIVLCQQSIITDYNYKQKKENRKPFLDNPRKSLTKISYQQITIYFRVMSYQFTLGIHLAMEYK